MSNDSPKILLVDDEVGHRTMLRAHLARAGYAVTEADDGDVAVHLAEQHPFDLVLLDLKMKRMGGMEALQLLQQSHPVLPVIIITAFSSVESAVEAMKKGARDYVTKPVNIAELKLTLERALHYEQLQQENASLRQRLDERFDFGRIIGRSAAMQRVFETLAMVAPTDATVLITGESGTGKELIANAVHQNSPRKVGPFVKVNCAALHENLLESELFGHEKGAFTGAEKQRKGRFELAHKGTLFLDEIGDLSLTTQAKILRVLQEGEFERLGGTETIRVDVRLLTATHKPLAQMVEAGSFRQDLYFRLNVVPIELPPLRERSEDIPLLARHFLEQYREKNRKNIRGIEPGAMERLTGHGWPGNIRELENTIERAVILCPGETITVHELPAALRNSSGAPGAVPLPGTTLKAMERQLILATLEETEGNRTRAAELLGITRQTLQNKLKEYDLS